VSAIHVVDRARNTINDGKAHKLVPMGLSPLPPQPLVSIIMSNYNYARFLSEAVESVLRQTYPRFELIICDDGSTDHSRALIESLAARDSRVQTIFKSNSGQAAAWNMAYGYASGEIICFLDSDDTYHPAKLEKVVDTFVRNPNAGLVCHRVRHISETGKPFGVPFPRDIDTGWLAQDALERGGWRHWPQTAGFCLRRAVADRLFPLPPHLTGFGDAYIQGVTQFLTELAAPHDPLAYYRMHEGNDSGSAKPTIASVAKVLEGTSIALEAIRAFVSAEFGDTLAERFRPDGFRSYWEYHLALHVLLGKPHRGIDGYSQNDLLARLPNSPRKLLWRLLLLLPANASRHAFQLWWGTSTWKQFTRPLAGLMGLK
jgi:glycosyltransferase involved in cell wall biosynthesis